jgi:DNA repair exonuclease SbcCD ATPase subunit
MIKFTKIRWKNFLSTGNAFTEVDLCRHGLTLITGENGAGKSTILDALTYSLFGKSFRGITVSTLVNSINEKDSVVEIEFSIGPKSYLVRRGQKPKVFDIYVDGELLPQEAKAKDYQRILEEQILKMSYKSFCQIVVLGSSNYVPFMQLSATDRRDIVENLLDINIFTIMNIMVKGKVSAVREIIKDKENSIDMLKTKIETKKEYIDKIKDQAKSNLDSIDDEIDQKKQEIEDAKNRIKDLEDKHLDLIGELVDHDVNKNSLSDLSLERREINSKLSDIKKDMDFFSQNDQCPVCRQDIGVDHKCQIVTNQKTKQSEHEDNLQKLIVKMDETKKRLDDQDEIQQTINQILGEKQYEQAKIDSCQTYIDGMLKRKQQNQSQENTLDDDIVEMKKLIHEGMEQTKEKERFIVDENHLEIIQSLLKDTGIKARIIKQYLPVMNNLINKYLKAMDFFCKFTLDENFNEEIKSRYRDDFSYYNLSEGERLRIDLALLFAWREVAKLKNSVSCNLLILDEVFDSSLDAAGTEEFMKLLKTFTSGNSNIFVISHKTDHLADKFHNHFVFMKKNNFSRIK